MDTREIFSAKKIALLSTGDEIVHGDILNSNAREIAKRLYDLGMQVGVHLSTSDNISEIETAIHFLLQQHEALIITGGLGPTSDDLTRHALSKAVHQPLEFDDATWKAIVERLQKFGYMVPPESNKQQALFPKGASIIPNPHGTAAGCQIEYQSKFIFMLPGPPSECLPMVEQIVVPVLEKHHFPNIFYHKSWLLFGVSEGQIAEELDSIVKPFNCITGYRIAYPYIEFKIHSNNEKDFLQAEKSVEESIQPYLITDGLQTASDLLIKKLITLSDPVQICDQATGGTLETILKTPQTHNKIKFSDKNNFLPHLSTFTITGLNDYWNEEKDCSYTTLTLETQNDNYTKEIPYRGIRVLKYAVEWLSWQINKLI